MNTLTKALLGISIVGKWYLLACILSFLCKDMGLHVLDHLRPIVMSLNQGIGFANSEMAEMVMHFLEYGFHKGFGQLWFCILCHFLCLCDTIILFHHTHKNSCHDTSSLDLPLIWQFWCNACQIIVRLLCQSIQFHTMSNSHCPFQYGFCWQRHLHH